MCLGVRSVEVAGGNEVKGYVRGLEVEERRVVCGEVVGEEEVV